MKQQSPLPPTVGGGGETQCPHMNICEWDALLDGLFFSSKKQPTDTYALPTCFHELRDESSSPAGPLARDLMSAGHFSALSFQGFNYETNAGWAS